MIITGPKASLIAYHNGSAVYTANGDVVERWTVSGLVAILEPTDAMTVEELLLFRPGAQQVKRLEN